MSPKIAPTAATLAMITATAAMFIKGLDPARLLPLSTARLPPVAVHGSCYAKGMPEGNLPVFAMS
jgi:hypothetical protein